MTGVDVKTKRPDIEGMERVLVPVTENPQFFKDGLALDNEMILQLVKYTLELEREYDE